MAPETEFRVPPLDGLAGGRRELERRAPQLQSLAAGEQSEMVPSLFAGLEFPDLTKLALLPGYRLEEAGRIFERFPRLQQLKVWFGTREQIGATLPYLADASRWPRLTHLDLQFFFRSYQRPEEIDCWPDLWVDRELSFELVRITGLSLNLAETLLQARFPRLRYLSLSTLPDGLLPLLARAHLPALEILDLRFSTISGEALQSFARTARHNLPSLREVGLEIYTGERVDYQDWNGAVVGGYDVQYSPEELERMFLEGTGIAVMREVPAW